jgi:hypothetical protein
MSLSIEKNSATNHSILLSLEIRYCIPLHIHSSSIFSEANQIIIIIITMTTSREKNELLNKTWIERQRDRDREKKV